MAMCKKDPLLSGNKSVIKELGKLEIILKGIHPVILPYF